MPGECGSAAPAADGRCSPEPGLPRTRHFLEGSNGPTPAPGWGLLPGLGSAPRVGSAPRAGVCFWVGVCSLGRVSSLGWGLLTRLGSAPWAGVSSPSQGLPPGSGSAPWIRVSSLVWGLLPGLGSAPWVGVCSPGRGLLPGLGFAPWVGVSSPGRLSSPGWGQHGGMTGISSGFPGMWEQVPVPSRGPRQHPGACAQTRGCPRAEAGGPRRGQRRATRMALGRMSPSVFLSRDGGGFPHNTARRKTLPGKQELGVFPA